MDGDKRATVMLLHGGSEDRLRQAMAQGLVTQELQRDIEDALAQAEDARVYAETMERKFEKQKSLISALEEEIKDREKRSREDAARYRMAMEAYKREEQRKKDNADRKETFLIAAMGAGAFIVANVIGRLLILILK